MRGGSFSSVFSEALDCCVLRAALRSGLRSAVVGRFGCGECGPLLSGGGPDFFLFEELTRMPVCCGRSVCSGLPEDVLRLRMGGKPWALTGLGLSLRAGGSNPLGTASLERRS